MVLQKPLIRFVLEPAARFMDRFSPKLKNTLFVLAFLGIILQYMAKGAGIVTYRYLIFFAVDCLFLGVMLLCSIRPGMQPVKFRPLPMLLLLGTGLMLLQSGLRLNVDYLPEAVLFLIAYPAVFLIWNNCDSSHIFRLLLRGMEISFVIYLVICLFFFPMEYLRYSGLFVNLNGTAGYLAITAACLLTECLIARKFSVPLVLRAILLGLCFSLLFYTTSRTGLLEFSIAAAALIAVIFLRLRKQKKLFFLRNLLTVCLAAALLFPTTIYMFQFSRPLAAATEKLIGQVFFGSTDPDHGLTPDELFTPEDALDLMGDRLSTEDRTFEQVTTGRSSIWMEYLRRTNLFGHSDSGAFTLPYGTYDMTISTAHMTILQLAYENGIFAGIFYLAFNLVCGIHAVIYALRRRDDPFAVVPLVVTVSYGVYSLLASTAVSFWYLCAFLYYLVQFPLMNKEPPAGIPERT